MGIVCRLQAWDFRNLRELDLPLGHGITLLLGPNGQGKTSVLEAAAYLGLLRSFRTQGIEELVRWGAQGFAVRGELADESTGDRETLAVRQGQRRCLQVNGKSVERASEFINRFLCVPLVPEDIGLVRGVSSGRRRFLDIAVAQQESGHVAALQRYREALAARNHLLRHGAPGQAGVLAAYEGLLVEHGARIEAARRAFVETLAAALGGVCDVLAGPGGAPLAVAYNSPGLPREGVTVPESALAEALRRALERNRERDARDGVTSAGPHRGDLLITLRGRPLAACGSEGECRLASLALRLAALAIARRRVGERRPVVALVDDVTGELDPARRRAFFLALTTADQTLITATQQPDELAGLVDAAYAVREGALTPL